MTADVVYPKLWKVLVQDLDKICPNNLFYCPAKDICTEKNMCLNATAKRSMCGCKGATDWAGHFNEHQIMCDFWKCV